MIRGLQDEISFPAEYPFKPPKITFKAVYHPNIDEEGQVCLPVIKSAENWKPATKTDQGKVSAPPRGPLRQGSGRRGLQRQPRAPEAAAS